MAGYRASFVVWLMALVLFAKWSKSSSGERGRSMGECGDKLEFKAFQRALPSFYASSMCCRRKDERLCW